MKGATVNRLDILSVLKNYKDQHSSDMGILELGVFGSVARGETTETSDIDVVIEVKQPNLLLLSAIRSELEEILHTHVDLVRIRARMNKFLKQQIEKEAIFV